MRAQATVFLLLASSSCASKPEPIDKPEPPDMSDVVVRFEQPTGTFDAAGAQRILDAYAAQATQVTELGLHESVVESLRTSLDEALRESKETQSFDPSLRDGEPTATAQAALSLHANGTIGIRRICDGWEVMPAPDPDNGSLSLRVNFSEQGLDPVVWGEALACRYLAPADARVLVDDGSGRKGDLRIWLGRSATFENFGDGTLLFDLDLNAEVQGVSSALALSFRFDPADSAVAVSVDAQPGHVVVSPTKPNQLTVTAQNGIFDCDLSGQQCTSDVGQSFSY